MDIEPTELPVITELFPISELAARSLINGFVSEDLSEPAIDAVINDFSSQNNPILEFIVHGSEFMNENTNGTFPANEYFMGALIAHASLSREAQLRGGRLPSIPQEIIESKRDDEFDIENQRGNQSIGVGVDSFEAKMRKFLSNEPNIVKIFAENGVTLAHLNTSAILMGFMDVWDLFIIYAEAEKLRKLF